MEEQCEDSDPEGRPDELSEEEKADLRQSIRDASELFRRKLAERDEENE